jgi:mannosyltransferase
MTAFQRARWRPGRRVAGLLLVVAAAVALRIPYLTERSLWYDEASSWQTARFPFPELMRSVRLNVHMPLYYLLLKGWMAVLGESVAAIRGFSVAFGALTVLAMCLFGRELYLTSAASDDDERGRLDDRAWSFGLMVAGLVAVSPCQIFASIEARMYSLGTALAALSSWMLLRIVREGGRGRLWWWYGVALMLLPYAHHYSLFTVAAQFIFLGLFVFHLTVVGERDQARAIMVRVVVTFVAAALVYLPGLSILMTQTARVQQDYWVRPLSLEIFFGTFNEFILPMPDYDQLPNGWIAFAAFAAACLAVAWKGWLGDGFVLELAIVPMVLSALVSTITPIWVGRFFRFTHLFVLAAIALAAWRISRRPRFLRPVLVSALFIGLLAVNIEFWKSLNIREGRGVKGAVEFILAERKPGETIVALDLTQYFPAKYYVGQRAKIRMVEPPFDLFWGTHLIRPEDTISNDQVDDELRRGVWLIGTLPTPAITPQLASAQPTLQREFTYYNHLHRRVYVHHYQAPEESRP